MIIPRSPKAYIGLYRKRSRGLEISNTDNLGCICSEKYRLFQGVSPYRLHIPLQIQQQKTTRKIMRMSSVMKCIKILIKDFKTITDLQFHQNTKLDLIFFLDNACCSNFEKIDI